MASSVNGNQQNVPLPSAGREKDGGSLNRKTAPASFEKGNTDNRPEPTGYKVFDAGQKTIRQIGNTKRVK